MIILDSTTKSLQIKLGGNVATNQLPFSVSYIDASSTATTPGEYDYITNNASTQTLIAPPASSTQRLIKSIAVYNYDTAVATVTIIYYNSSGTTSRNIIVVTLAAGDQLFYEDGEGWIALDANGNVKNTSTTASGAVSSVSNANGTLTISPTTGNVVASIAPAAAAAAISPYISYSACGFVNKIRNPVMDVVQRGTSGTVSSGSSASTSDGWIVSTTGSSVTWSQGGTISGALAFIHCLQLTGASGNTGVTLSQRIESDVAAPLNGKTITFQIYFWNANGGSTIMPTLTVTYPNSTDAWGGATTDVISAVNLQSVANGSAATLAYVFNDSGNASKGYQITVTLPALGNGAYVYFSGADIRITPGLSTGQTSTPPIPEIRPSSLEWPYCLRYLAGFGETTGIVGLAYATSATAFGVYIPFKNKMRAAPNGITVATPGNLQMASMAGSNVAAVTALSFSNASEDGIFLTGTVASGLTSGTVYQLKVNTALAGNVYFSNNTSGGSEL